MDSELYTEMCSKHRTGFLQVQWRLYRFVLFFLLFVLLRLDRDPLYRKKAGYNYILCIYNYFLSILVSLVSVQFGSAIFAGSWISK